MGLELDWQLAQKACEYVVEGQWEVRNSTEVVMAQVECHYGLARLGIASLQQQGISFAYQEDTGGAE